MMARPRVLNRAGNLAMGAVLAVGMISMADGLYIPAKAMLAQQLLQRAWQRGERSPAIDTDELRPWPWADTFPVARLTSDATDDEVFVLSGGSGRTLAFGPGHLQTSALPGHVGNSVIAGHRDTHFRFLADVALGDNLVVDRRDGERVVYEIVALDVVDARRAQIALDGAAPTLTLITCYPFDAITPGGPLRYVVSARAVSAEVPMQAAATGF
ncbi:MAG: class GN sortase [Pseudomonadota bacterium]